MMDVERANNTSNAFQRAVEVQRKASREGFDWPDITGVLDKVAEELEEIRQARKCGDIAHMQDELGDLLFAAVSVARFLDVAPEICLENATKRFESRMEKVRKLAQKSGCDLATCSAAALDALWEQAKELASQ